MIRMNSILVIMLGKIYRKINIEESKLVLVTNSASHGNEYGGHDNVARY